MSTEDLAEQLLNGPRGRRLLSALVAEASEANALEPWTRPAWGHDDLTALDASMREQLRQRLGQAVAVVDLAALRARDDPRLLWSPLADAVCSARYWQHPDTEDQVLADPLLAPFLSPLAQAVADSAAAAWWSQPVDLNTQQHLSWLFEGRDRYQPIASGAQEAMTSQVTSQAPAALAAPVVLSALERWREEAVADEERCRVQRPRDVGANWSGTWWSSPPQLPELVVSTPVLPATAGAATGAGRGAGYGAGGEFDEVDNRRWELPVGMSMVEDDLGIEEVHARALRLREGVRVFEVHDAQAWCELVAAHPRSVTFSRRHDWWRATGWDGAWVLPDWASVAREWDGVHLSARGYLAVSGRLLETTLGWEAIGALVGEDVEGIRPGAARTLLAGWSPGQTYWLTDVVEEVGDPVLWRSAGDDYPLRWRPHSGTVTTGGTGS